MRMLATGDTMVQTTASVRWRHERDGGHVAAQLVRDDGGRAVGWWNERLVTEQQATAWADRQASRRAHYAVWYEGDPPRC
jgi:hypothetical protein